MKKDYETPLFILRQTEARDALLASGDRWSDGTDFGTDDIFGGEF